MVAPAQTESGRYFIWTIGCQMNEADSRRLASELEAIGYEAATDPEDAEIVVLNTCVVRQSAENKIYGRLGSLKPAKTRRPNLVVALMGCLVGVKENAALRERFPFVDVFMPPSDTRPLLDYLAAQNRVHTTAAAFDGEVWDYLQAKDLLLPATEREQTVTAFVPAVLGCSHGCSFCIIPYRRGAEHSRPQAAILDEVRNLAAQGVKEVMLLGQIIDRYGRDLPDSGGLPALLRAVHDVPGLERIRFLTSHPSFMTDGIIDTVAELPKLCPHLELPIQAGNDQVLKAMRRGYTADDYRRLIDRIRQGLPDAAINTDIIVGFPGETATQFEDTYRIIEELLFDKVHIAKYSPRPGTMAERRLPDDVDANEKERRRAALDELQKAILEAKNQTHLNTTVKVLVEGRHKGRWRGRTPHNRLVFIDDQRPLAGRTVDVRIEHTGPYSLRGKCADANDLNPATTTE